MPRYSIRWQLCRPHFSVLLIMLFLILVFVAIIGWLLWEIFRDRSSRFDFYRPQDFYFPLGLFGLILLSLLAVANHQLWYARSKHHPSLMRLKRYGPMEDVFKEIQQELSDVSQVVRIGRRYSASRFSFFPDDDDTGQLGDDEAWITPSWLIFVSGYDDQVYFLRLETLILSYYEGTMLTLVDRYGYRWWIRGDPDGRSRVMAQIMVRVPWAISHFDAETERRWNDNRQEVIAEVDQRRDQIRMADSSVTDRVLQSEKPRREPERSEEEESREE
jgi:hypothetical protein